MVFIKATVVFVEYLKLKEVQASVPLHGQLQSITELLQTQVVLVFILNIFFRIEGEKSFFFFSSHMCVPHYITALLVKNDVKNNTRKATSHFLDLTFMIHDFLDT